MSITFQISSFAPAPVAASPVRTVRASIAPVAALVRAALQRIATPSHAERHARDVDVLSTSTWNGRGRSGANWNDIGYRI